MKMGISRITTFTGYNYDVKTVRIFCLVDFRCIKAVYGRWCSINVWHGNDKTLWAAFFRLESEIFQQEYDLAMGSP